MVPKAVDCVGGIQQFWRKLLQLQLFGSGYLLGGGSFLNTQKYKILAYCGFVSAVILVQIGSAYKLMRQITSNEVNADKLSLLTVCIITIQDFYLTMMHMYFLMTANVIMGEPSSITSTLSCPSSCWCS